MNQVRDEHALARLYSLPIQDLQSLLTFAGESRAGKHRDLVERCYTAMKSSMVVQNKFDELYNHRFGQGSSMTIPYPRDSKSFSRSNPSMSNQANIDICFLPLTFNEELAVISPAHRIPAVKATVDNSSASYNFFFLLTAQHASGQKNKSSAKSLCWRTRLDLDVATSTYFNPSDPSKIEYKKQILLRFTSLDSTSYVNGYARDNLPMNLCLTVNHKNVLLPQPKASSKPNSDILRPGRPIDITSYCRLSPVISNSIEISWFTQDTSRPPPTYVAVIYLTQHKSVAQLLARLSHPSAIRPAIDTQRTIMKTLSAQETGGDFQIATTSLRIPLICPATYTRMKLPGRATTCAHVHCFDIEGYLRMNEKNPSKSRSLHLSRIAFHCSSFFSAWLCPVCHKIAAFSDLFVDQFFLDVIAQCPPNTKSIEYDIHGRWTPIIEEKNSTRKHKQHLSSMDKSDETDTDSDSEQNLQKKSELNCRWCSIYSRSFVVEVITDNSSKPVQNPIPIIELDDDWRINLVFSLAVMVLDHDDEQSIRMDTRAE